MTRLIPGSTWNFGRVAALLTSALLMTGCAGSKSEGEKQAGTQQTAASENKPEDKTETKPAEQQTAPAGEQAAPQGQLLTEGTPAPDFVAEAHNGTTVQLSKLGGKPVVLYFYPKDETPGCTVEAQSFRDDHADFEKLGATVLGVSLDSIESHKQFADNHKLQFPLLADTKGDIAAKYGVSTEGGYARRVTFVIDQKGVIAKVFPEVTVNGHSDEVLETVKQLAM